MKKLMIMVVAVMAMATSYAAATWAYLDTVGVNNETTSDIANYAAYFCSAESAAGIFGGNSTQDKITEYLASTYVDYSAGISGMSQMIPYGDGFDEGVYTFVPSVQKALENGSYIAVVAYLNDAGNQFRVFEAPVYDGMLKFTDDPEYAQLAAGTSAGVWTAAAIPEPTSAMLLLFGLAGLALKRKRS